MVESFEVMVNCGPDHISMMSHCCCTLINVLATSENSQKCLKNKWTRGQCSCGILCTSHQPIELAVILA